MSSTNLLTYSENDSCRPALLGMGWFPDQPGGLNRYFSNLHAALTAAGAHPRAVVVGPAEGAPASVTAVGRHSSPLPWRLTKFTAAAMVAMRGGTVVDAHFALYAALPLLLRGRGRPVLAHFQGPWAQEGATLGQNDWRVRSKRMWEAAVYRHADRAVVLSDAFKQVLVRDYGVPPWRVDVLPPGVDTEQFSPGDAEQARRQLGINLRGGVALTVRRLVPRMGLDVLLQAWITVVARHPHAVLLVAGDGPERSRLEDLASPLGRGVRFLGRLEDDVLVSAYRAADVSVVPSVALEGFGLVTLESLACGTPVVVTDVAGLAETPARLQGDLVVPPGDPSALAKRLDDALAGSLPLPDRVSCRQFAKGFSWEAVARRHMALYKALGEPADGSRLRVVYLDHVACLSGGELALLRLLPALAGVQAHVILAEEGPLVDRLREVGIYTEVLPMDPRTKDLRKAQVRPGSVPIRSLLATFGYVLRLSRRLRTLRPDLVHTNSLKAGVYGSLAARLAGIKVVWHVRDRISPDYLPRPAVVAVRAMLRWLPNAVVANSRTTMSTTGPLRRRSGRGPVTALVASPVDQIPAWATTEQHRSLRIGMLGRLAPWKGQHVFLAAFARAFAGTQERAVLIGGPLFGEEDYERQLRQLVAELGLGERVDIRGHQEDVATELRRLDVLVHASTVPEPFGQVVVQGMAAGLPVVASAEGGPGEVVTDGEDGILTPPTDVEGLAEVLRRLSKDTELRARLGKAARVRAAAYSPEAVAPRMMAVYRDVTAGPRPLCPDGASSRRRGRPVRGRA